MNVEEIAKRRLTGKKRGGTGGFMRGEGKGWGEEVNLLTSTGSDDFTKRGVDKNKPWKEEGSVNCTARGGGSGGRKKGRH